MNDGSPPPSRITRVAIASSSGSVTPGRTASHAAFSARESRCPPSRIASISVVVFVRDIGRIRKESGRKT